MKDYLKKNWPLIIIFLLGLVPLIWFRRGMIIAGGDNYTMINPSANYSDQFYSWVDKTDAGVPSSEKAKIFPFTFFWFLGGKIGFSLVNLQRIWTVLHFMLPGIFIFFLIKKMYRFSANSGNFAGLIGSVLYMFNYLVIVDAFHFALRPVLTFLPVMFFLWIKGLEENKFSLKYSILFALTSLFYSSANLNFPSVSPVYIILFAYLIFYVLFYRRLKHALFFAFVSFSLLFVVNLWWGTDFYFSMVMASKSFIAAVREYDFLGSTYISEAFRSMGFWAFRTMFGDKPLVPFSALYYEFPLLLLTFLIPVLAFSSLFFKTKNKYKYFFALLALLGIFLAKGSNPPFGYFYRYLYDNFPPFSSFREPFAKFTLISVFAFSVLIGFFTEDLLNYLTKNKKKTFFVKFFPAGLIFIILINSYPLLTGKNIQDESWYQDSTRSLYVKIPDYWLQIGKWFESRDPKARVMVFPRNFYGQSYSWESGMTGSGSAAVPLLPNPVILHSPRVSVNEENRLANLSYQMLYLGENANLLPYLDLFNVDFVLQQNDAAFHNEVGIFDPLVMKKILDSQSYLKPEVSFGQISYFSGSAEDKNKTVNSMEALKVFSVQRNGVSKQIYSPQKQIFVFGKLESFMDIFSFFQYNGVQGYYFSEDQPENSGDLKKISSLIMMNLKERLKSKTENGDFVYEFDIPRGSSYKLLINNYLLESLPKNDLSKYFFRLNGNDLKILNNIGSWQITETKVLKEELAFLQTNLPVEIIKKEYLTSPFWLIEDTETVNSIISPVLSFTRVNPTKYTVEAMKADGPFLLVLSEAYHPQWRVYYKNKEIKADHFLANGYANGWYLQPGFFENNTDFTFELRYKPQKFAQSAAIISISAISLLFSLLLFISLKEKFKKN